MNTNKTETQRIERIRRRVHGREQAREILSLIDLPHSDCVDGFLDELASVLKPKQTEAESVERKRQFAEFANYRLERGEHAGQKLEDIPREYLEWWYDSSIESLETITGYLEATEPDGE